MAHGGAFLLISIPVALLVIFFFQRWRLLAALIEEINKMTHGGTRRARLREALGCERNTARFSQRK